MYACWMYYSSSTFLCITSMSLIIHISAQFLDTIIFKLTVIDIYELLKFFLYNLESRGRNSSHFFEWERNEDGNKNESREENENESESKIDHHHCQVSFKIHESILARLAAFLAEARLWCRWSVNQKQKYADTKKTSSTTAIESATDITDDEFLIFQWWLFLSEDLLNNWLPLGCGKCKQFAFQNVLWCSDNWLTF